MFNKTAFGWRANSGNLMSPPNCIKSSFNRCRRITWFNFLSEILTKQKRRNGEMIMHIFLFPFFPIKPCIFILNIARSGFWAKYKSRERVGQAFQLVRLRLKPLRPQSSLKNVYMKKQIKKNIRVIEKSNLTRLAGEIQTKRRTLNLSMHEKTDLLLRINKRWTPTGNKHITWFR